MLGLLWLIPVLPFLGFLILALIGSRLPRNVAAMIGAGSVGLSALLTLILAVTYLASPPPGGAYSQTLWTWMSVDNFQPSFTLYLDQLSLILIFVITFVGFLIHLYSIEFMQEMTRATAASSPI